MRSLFTFATLALILSISGCAKRERRTAIRPGLSPAHPISRPGRPRVNLNTASAAELETLPGIGKALAARIIEHRQKFGPFRRVEHLIVVPGISDRRFRAMQDLIAAE